MQQRHVQPSATCLSDTHVSLESQFEENDWILLCMVEAVSWRYKSFVSSSNSFKEQLPFFVRCHTQNIREKFTAVVLLAIAHSYPWIDIEVKHITNEKTATQSLDPDCATSLEHSLSQFFNIYATFLLVRLHSLKVWSTLPLGWKRKHTMDIFNIWW